MALNMPEISNRSHKAPQSDVLIVAAIAGLIFVIQSLAWPLSQGRDCSTYLLYYLEMGRSDPLYNLLMLFRTPVAPLFHGLLLQGGQAGLDEVLMGILFCVSILVTYRIGLLWSRRGAWLASLALALYPPYGSIYHLVSSEGLFSVALILWTWFILATLAEPTLKRFFAHAAWVFLLVLIRPSAQIFLAFSAFPFLLPGITWAGKLKRSAAFLLASLVLLLGYSSYNLVRYSDFTVSRSSKAQIPLYRIFVQDKLPIRAENGPASAQLVQAIEHDLLPREPYRSYQIDLASFLSSGDSRMWGDLVSLSDRTWGWDSDYATLYAAALETIHRHPWPYVKGVIRSWGGVLIRNPTSPAPQVSKPDNTRTITYNAKGLPVPSEGQLIPASNLWWLASSPDQRIQSDWENYYRTGKLVIKDPALAQRQAQLGQKLEQMLAVLPSRDGLTGVAAILNELACFYPPMLLWIAIGALGLAFRRDSRDRALWFMVALSLVYLLVSFTGMNTVVAYRLPFDPIFILTGSIGIDAIAQKYRANAKVA
jgi:hypothetical protein